MTVEGILKLKLRFAKLCVCRAVCSERGLRLAKRAVGMFEPFLPSEPSPYPDGNSNIWAYAPPDDTVGLKVITFVGIRWNG